MTPNAISNNLPIVNSLNKQHTQRYVFLPDWITKEAEMSLMMTEANFPSALKRRKTSQD